MAEETTQHPGNINPDDIRGPGAGGGEQPASYLLTNEPIDRPGARSGFETGADTERNAADDSLAAEGESETAEEPKTIADKLAYARAHLGDDVFVLEEGSELYNTSGLRVTLGTPAVVRIEGGSPDPVRNDQRFASFLHPSDRNWGLNIKQLGRPFDRARNVALSLVCERHGEDLEWEPYGKPRQCPKCAEEALAEAATVQPVAPTEHPNTPEAFAPPAEIEPIKVGDQVVLNMDEPNLTVMTVLSVEFGIANCAWTDGDGQPHEKIYGVSVLRRARPGHEIPAWQSEP